MLSATPWALKPFYLKVQKLVRVLTSDRHVKPRAIRMIGDERLERMFR